MLFTACAHWIVRCCDVQGLKNHAVTMFEVGKLTDETLDNFLAELEKVCSGKRCELSKCQDWLSQLHVRIAG